MKIRFNRNDAIDTKSIEQEVANITDKPIYQVELTEEEVGYIKQFVEVCAGVVTSGGHHLEMNVAKPESEDKCLILAEMADDTGV